MGRDVASVVDARALEDWLDGEGLDKGPLEDMATLSGGTQNVVVSFRKAGKDYVLRRPPFVPRRESNETMRREARMLSALAGTDVPHPQLIAACADEEVLGVAFYVMQRIDGFNATSGPLPAPHCEHADWRRRMGFALVEGAARLGRLDYKVVGLEGFGKPDNYLHRQVQRWKSQLQGYETYVGWPGCDSLPGIEDVGEYLGDAIPSGFQPGIIHGDYSLGNVMFRTDAPELAAIIDWELTTIGDPLLDLGWVLATWQGGPVGDLNVLQVTPWEGFPIAEELIEHYGRHSQRDLVDVDWYAILACYKLAIILEGTFARACAGKAPMETGRMLHDTSQRLLKRALYRINRFKSW